MGSCQGRKFWRDFDSAWRDLESDLSLEADRHLHRVKPEKKDLNPSQFDQKGRPLNHMIGLAVLQ